MGNSFKHWDDRCSLEHSLPDIGSVLTGSDRRNLLEHSLPVASVLRAHDHPNFRKNQFKSQFTTGSERSKEPQIIPIFEKNHSNPNSLPVASVLRNPDHPNSCKNPLKSQFTTGSEHSKGPTSVQFLTELPIHYR